MPKTGLSISSRMDGVGRAIMGYFPRKGYELGIKEFAGGPAHPKGTVVSKLADYSTIQRIGKLCYLS